MSIRFYNTITRQKEAFQPLESGKVKMYTCGPTVYDFAHIGNYRTFIFEDLLRRYLEFRGFDVNQAMNLTDVDDNTIRRSRERDISLTELTDEFKAAFHADLKTLNMQAAQNYPEATNYIPEMITMISDLETKGYTYTTPDGSVFFNIGKYEHYGKLANLNPDEMLSGGRVADDSYEKEGARDFALWKGYKSEDGDVHWESPWGKGRPGWHIECSVMSTELLGPHFDIHCGGVDNIFPHHENELAQSVCATGADFVNYWLHSEYLLVDNKKMSKSLNNFYTLRDLLDQGYPAEAIRWMLITTHYRQKLNFSVSRLEEAQKAVNRLREFFSKLQTYDGLGEEDASDQIHVADDHFTSAMDDDLNISGGLAAIFELVRWGNRSMVEGRLSAAGATGLIDLIRRFDHVLGVLDMESGLKVEIDAEFVEAKIAARKAARANKDFATSDAIRDELVALGVDLIDTPDGTKWKMK
ncbi:MAG: cysteine--tRNA ligase [Candidatus Marinimicrobia bacterium]|jgi:cysteinyl-tRNA synthetase|nr:cysteine--tRNA ligase [Candidatus Neomarinimicrobiota bacterium]MBT4360888.1 cysteine--tRNA ligase [Candidatus Neomarinimicrobiota bacterium]MBT4715350.1 cysteine--tRNA ligase [Candidatus Neomarinimicrobiota bacterium]MBT4947012.1 cysteine--tRNA ligase [Candidatus Neomarinimicrobiota bacterium]MBT5268359.1 cysteine--tRNA ligase [Candidatus Neomarinimicrobiota bacterium]